MIRWKFVLVLLLLVTACQQGEESPATPLGAGFRYSRYGPWYDPGADYWVGVGQQMAANFGPDALPQAVWIVSTQGGKGTALNFPYAEYDPLIFPASADANEAVLTLFDEMGGQVWLQVEPGMADVEKLIDILLERYSHHPSVIGVGVDVEWYGDYGSALGVPVTDEVAASWVTAVRQHAPHYQIFLKHWLPDYMPPTERDGIVFINDSQGVGSLDQLVAEFKEWGEIFAPAPVGFQIGYSSDKVWWSAYENPPKTIGDAILTAVPNTFGLYWVDFTVLEVFPPAK